MAKEKEGANKFTTAADKFFGEVALQLEETVNLKDVQGVQRAAALADLVYKINQSIKLMKEPDKKETKSSLNGGISVVDKWANQDRK